MSVGAPSRHHVIAINPQPEGIPEEIGVDAQGRRWRRHGEHTCSMICIQISLITGTILTAYIAGENKNEIGIAFPILFGLTNLMIAQVQANC